MRTIKFRAWDRKEKETISEALEMGNLGLGAGRVFANHSLRFLTL